MIAMYDLIFNFPLLLVCQLHGCWILVDFNDSKQLPVQSQQWIEKEVIYNSVFIRKVQVSGIYSHIFYTVYFLHEINISQ